MLPDHFLPAYWTKGSISTHEEAAGFAARARVRASDSGRPAEVAEALANAPTFALELGCPRRGSATQEREHDCGRGRSVLELRHGAGALDRRYFAGAR
jgi:hypothetical protein